MPEIKTAVRVVFEDDDGKRVEKICVDIPDDGDVVMLDGKRYMTTSTKWEEQERTKMLYPVIAIYLMQNQQQEGKQ